MKNAILMAIIATALLLVYRIYEYIDMIGLVPITYYVGGILYFLWEVSILVFFISMYRRMPKNIRR